MSAQVDVSVTAPSPEDVPDWTQCAESMPEPESVQFQLTVTSEVFHPAPFAAGETTGLSVGAVVSAGAGGMTVPLRRICAEWRLFPTAQSSTCVITTRLTSPAAT